MKRMHQRRIHLIFREIKVQYQPSNPSKVDPKKQTEAVKSRRDSISVKDRVSNQMICKIFRKRWNRIQVIKIWLCLRIKIILSLGIHSILACSRCHRCLVVCSWMRAHILHHRFRFFSFQLVKMWPYVCNNPNTACTTLIQVNNYKSISAHLFNKPTDQFLKHRSKSNQSSKILMLKNPNQ